ncbi:MAG: LCCL domain-containing protein [Xenococcaceae cyanobacterium MO_188.B32]|nr:LCCL domain-containing protein [Xenococcaceae cyanobacterium MO_188.B32]
MKLDKSPPTIILSLIGTAIALDLFAAKTVNAQTKLQSVPEIGWSIRLNSFELDRQNFGQVFTFKCPTTPESQVYAPVWGTDIYTLNSGLCQAAVHAGMITREGGLINVELTAGESRYKGSDRFGVKSKSHAREVYSFRFIGNPIAIESADETNNDAEKPPSRRRPSAIERTVGNGVRRGIERTISDSIRDIFR